MQLALGLSQPSCRFAVSGHGWGAMEVNPAAGGQSSKMMHSHRHLARQLLLHLLPPWYLHYFKLIRSAFLLLIYAP
jgi:hypothetical protein